MSTTGTTLRGTGLSKSYGRKVVFSGISFDVGPANTLLVTGRNGSGKSTLARIMCGVLSPTGGAIALEPDPGENHADRVRLFGLVAPYLQVYEEFTAAENLAFATRIRGGVPDGPRIRALLDRVGLNNRKDDTVRGFSSGMKQRVKYAMALVHDPDVLVLDEPMANLDAEGTAMVREVMREHARRRTLIVATNDLTDCERFDARVDLSGSARG
jgi:heme exporter protein A